MTRFKVRHVANVTIVTEMEADNLAHAIIKLLLWKK